MIWEQKYFNRTVWQLLEAWEERENNKSSFSLGWGYLNKTKQKKILRIWDTITVENAIIEKSGEQQEIHDGLQNQVSRLEGQLKVKEKKASRGWKNSKKPTHQEKEPEDGGSELEREKPNVTLWRGACKASCMQRGGASQSSWPPEMRPSKRSLPSKKREELIKPAQWKAGAVGNTSEKGRMAKVRDSERSR